MASRSLGRLTLDLVARTGGFEQGMSRAARHSRTQMQQIQREARQLARVISGVLVAAAGVVSVQVTRTINDMDRLAKSAQAIGLTVEQLTALEFAASLSGVSNEQLATSMMRLSRSMADAARDTGVAKDAFKALGIEATNTDGSLRDSEAVMKDIADRFAGMEDGAQKTALAMDIFGRSGAALIPLLNQGADGINAMQLEAAQLGLVIDTQTARAAERFNDDLTRMGSVMTGVWRQMTAELLPALNTLTTTILEAQRETTGFSDTFDGTAERLVRAVAFMVNAVDGFVRVVQIAGRLTALAFINMETAGLRFADSVVNGPIRAVNALIDLVNRAPFLDIEFRAGPIAGGVSESLAMSRRMAEEARADIESILQQPLRGTAILETFERVRAELGELGPAARTAGNEMADGITDPMQAAPGKVRDAVAETIAALIREADTFGLSRSEIAAYDLALQGATGTQIEFAQALIGSIEDQRQLQELMSQGASVYDQTRSPAEALNIEILRLNDLLEAGAINWDTYSRAIFDAQERFDAMRETSEEAQEEMSQFAVQAARNMQSAFADFLFDPFSSSLRDMASNFARTIHRMVSELLAQQLLLSFLNAMNPAAGLGTALFGGAREKGGPVESGKTYLVGEKGPELFVPQGAGRIEPHDVTREYTQSISRVAEQSKETSLLRDLVSSAQMSSGSDIARSFRETISRIATSAKESTLMQELMLLAQPDPAAAGQVYLSGDRQETNNSFRETVSRIAERAKEMQTLMLPFGGARADGGPVSPGKAYMVGEQGPELFVPNTAGNIQPNGEGGHGVRIINVIDPSMVADYMSGPGGDQVILNILQRNAGAVRQVVS